MYGQSHRLFDPSELRVVYREGCRNGYRAADGRVDVFIWRRPLEVLRRPENASRLLYRPLPPLSRRKPTSNFRCLRALASSLCISHISIMERTLTRHPASPGQPPGDASPP